MRISFCQRTASANFSIASAASTCVVDHGSRNIYAQALGPSCTKANERLQTLHERKIQIQSRYTLRREPQSTYCKGVYTYCARPATKVGTMASAFFAALPRQPHVRASTCTIPMRRSPAKFTHSARLGTCGAVSGPGCTPTHTRSSRPAASGATAARHVSASQSGAPPNTMRVGVSATPITAMHEHSRHGPRISTKARVQIKSKLRVLDM